MDYSKLKELRSQTGVSFSLCKKALEESNDNIDKAKELLTQWGAKKIAEKSDRTTSEGGIFHYVHHNKKIGSMIELNCETDFVGGNADFKAFGMDIAMQVAFSNPQNVEDLMKQEHIKNPGKTIEDLLKDSIMKFGENIKLSRYIRWEVGQQ